MGIKIAAPLLILEGQRPAWIVDVLGVTRQSLNLWMHRVNNQGVKALAPVSQPGRPPRLRLGMGWAERKRNGLVCATQSRGILLTGGGW
jgi:transposase